MQILCLLAELCFFVPSRSKSMRLPSKRIDFNLQNTKKNTSVSNQRLCICLVSVDYRHWPLKNPASASKCQANYYIACGAMLFDTFKIQIDAFACQTHRFKPQGTRMHRSAINLIICLASASREQSEKKPPQTIHEASSVSLQSTGCEHSWRN